MGIVLVLMWTLQLFPATARLAPIYNPVTHGAAAVPVAARRAGDRNRSPDAAIQGAATGSWHVVALLWVGAVMLVAHWWWAEFLLTPSARNAVFAADQWDYYIKVGDWRYQFWTAERGFLDMARGLAFAAVTAIVSARVGLWIGRGMARVQR
jgi:hypothetical protein